MVKINCKVNATANTFEDALLEVQKQLILLYTKSHTKAISDEYHYWDVENGGDVDWYPFKNTTEKSKASFHVENTRTHDED